MQSPRDESGYQTSSSAPLSPLFRSEALTHQRHRSLGDIVLVRPVSFSFLTAFTVTVAVAILIFFMWGSYTKKARVSGHLVPSQGLVKVYAPERGAVVERLVRDGQSVRKGDVLFVLDIERQSKRGAAQTEIISQLSLQQQSLQEEQSARTQLQREHEHSLSTELSHLREQISQIEAELRVQTHQIQLAETTFQRYRQLQLGHFVPDVRVHEKEAILLEHRGRLHSLISTKVTLLKELSRVQAELNELPWKSGNELAQVKRNISSIKQQLAETSAAREVMITAPRDGMVTATMAYAGQVITENVPMLSIIPSGTQLQAELYATSRAIGFVKPGNGVLLRYEAYPYQKFGAYDGVVTEISRSALRAEELPVPVDPTETYYKITVSLAKQAVLAYGKLEPLQSGMKVQADVLLDRRTLLEWVMDPLYSVLGRTR
jgi:membrane fusion protein